MKLFCLVWSNELVGNASWAVCTVQTLRVHILIRYTLTTIHSISETYGVHRIINNMTCVGPPKSHVTNQLVDLKN